jgi:hypothetical protein
MKNYPHSLDSGDACQYLWPSHNRTAGRRWLGHAAVSHHGALSYPRKGTRPWNRGNGRPPLRQGWHAGGKSTCYWSLGTPNPTWLSQGKTSTLCLTLYACPLLMNESGGAVVQHLPTPTRRAVLSIREFMADEGCDLAVDILKTQ